MTSNKVIIHCLNAFDEHRSTNEKAYNNFFQRIKNLNLDDLKINPSKEKKIKKDRSLNFFKKINFFLEIIVLFNKQKKRLKINKGNFSKIIAIASNRLIVKDDIYSSMKTYFETTGESKARINELGDFLNTYDNLVLVDAKHFSTIWSKKNKNNDNIFIFDTTFIVYLFITSSFLKVSFLKELYTFYKRYSSINNFLNKKEKFIRSLLVISLKKMIGSSKNIQSFFLTANSTIIEILRATLIASRNTSSIIEILHGIVMIPHRNYIKKLQIIQKKYLPISNCSQKYIEQINGLPLIEGLSLNSFYSKDIAINSFLSNTLKEKIDTHKDYPSFLKRLRSSLGTKLLNDTQIITLFGGTNLEGKYFQSNSYKLELFLIKKTLQFLNENEAKARFFYINHPANGIFPNSQLDMINEMGVYLLKDSLTGYLVSDKCISLISSCLFEMNWFGGLSFTPMIVSDNMYTKKYLSEIFYPEYDGVDSLLSRLKNFTNIKHSQDFNIKIKSRIEKLAGKQYFV